MEKEQSSFTELLFCGEIDEELVFPYPQPDPLDVQKADQLINSFYEFARESYDPNRVEEQGWVGDEIIAGLGERSLLGLYLPEKYGGQGLSQTSYCRVFEAIGSVDSTLAVVMGVHQSIGMKGIYLFGTDEQKERFLPDLAAGRKLAAFALTEPNAGSDAYNIESRATPQPDGSYILHGEKRFIGNGAKDVVVTFARTDEGRHVALILEKGMPGFEPGRRYKTLGLRGNDLRHLHYRGVRVPRENVLGEEGDGFKIAMEVLKGGRLSLGAGSVGAVSYLLRLAVEHIHERRQFGRRLADFELVQDKIAWMSATLYGLRAMSYLTTGLADRGDTDITLESAMVKVAGTEFLWYAANRAFQMAGGIAYTTDKPYEKILRDIRIFPIFEGANDVMRMYIALSGLKPLGEELSDLKNLEISQPLEGIGTLAGYVGKRIRKSVRPDRLTMAHTSLDKLADPVAGQVKHLRAAGERLLREHGQDVVSRQLQLKRLAESAIEIYAQTAAISYLSSRVEILEENALEQERMLAETFCQLASDRVKNWLDQTEQNEDGRVYALAQAEYRKMGFQTEDEHEEKGEIE